MRKRLAFLLPLLAVALLFISGTSAGAEEELKLNKSSYTFGAKSPESINIKILDAGERIDDAASDNEKIAKVTCFYKNSIDVDARGVGTCNIKLTGSSGKTAAVKITVTQAYMDAYFKNEISDLGSYWYRLKKFYVEGPNGTSGKLIIGKTKYKFKIKKGGKTLVKLKKIYKENTKYTLVAKKGNASATIKGRLKSIAYVYDGKGSGKKFKLRASNVIKGDIVCLTYKGKTYKKKVSKIKGDFVSLSYKLKDKIKKNATVYVVIKDKDNKKLYKQKFILENGAFFHGSL